MNPNVMEDIIRSLAGRIARLESSEWAAGFVPYLFPPQTPAGYDIMASQVDFIQWTTLDAFTTAGLVVGAQAANCYMVTPVAINGDAQIRSTTNWPTLFAAGKKTIVEWPIVNLNSVANVDRYLLMTRNSGAPPNMNIDHMGFEINNADIFATSSDGVAQDKTDTGVNLATGAQLTILRAVCLYGTDVNFYINGVWVARHTLRIPNTILNYYLNMAMRTLVAAAATLNIGTWKMVREY